MDDYEKKILSVFVNSSIPEYYYLDHTDNILFLEDLDAEAESILKKKKLYKDFGNWLIHGYALFLEQTDLKDYDDELVEYLNLVHTVVYIALKYATKKSK